jgi:phage terminase large subunit-like protein
VPQIVAKLGRINPVERDALFFDWETWGREDQKPPPRDWRTWLMLGGRGAGKTHAGAAWVKMRALGDIVGLPPAGRIALVAPTFDEARLVMIEGASGLLEVHDDASRPKYQATKRLLTWPNGAIATVFSAEDPDGLRGPQFDLAWCDELAKWRYPEAAWDMLQFALRVGEAPQCVVTTTPRPIPVLKRIMDDAETALTRATTFDNCHLAAGFRRAMEARYGGTNLGRQELNAEIIADDPNAMFKRDWIERARVKTAPEFRRVVVAIDPPAGKGPRANACGIVCAGLGVDGRAYVLDDHTMKHASPARWAGRAIALYRARQADRIVAEVNQGGAMVEAVLREIDPSVPYRAVHATRGKRVRAEPVAALYEQGRVSHVGAFPELEDEMCTALGEDGASPDRLDALVWAVSELMLRRGEPRIWVA